MQQYLTWIDIGLLSIGALIAAGAALVRVGRGGDPLRGSPLRPNRLGPIAVWVCITAHLAANTAGGSMGRRLTPAGAGDGVRQLCEGVLASTCGAIVSTAVCLMVGYLAFAGGWRTLGLARRSVGRDLAAAVPALLASLAVCNGIAWVTLRVMRSIVQGFKPHEHAVFTVLHQVELPRVLQHLALLSALLLAPLSEELLFRGILQTAARRLVPPRQHSLRHRWFAIALVSAIFGFMHSTTPQNVPALIFFGAVLGYLYERTGSLMLPILVHVLFNGKSLLWDALMR